MSFETLEPRRWTPGRFWATIGSVFALQLSLILWLGDRSSATPPPIPTPPRVRLNHEPGELFALLDPTLFALPHHEEFSSVLMVPEFHPADWSRDPLWLR